jgi:hypothetical protein
VVAAGVVLAAGVVADVASEGCVGGGVPGDEAAASAPDVALLSPAGV